jgi:DNA invertase Pin-like site-specific DNA recombinase
VEELHTAILAYLRGQRDPGGDRLPPPGSQVLIYARVAVDEVGVPALVAQEARCHAYARVRGWVVVAALREVHDGAADTRPVLRALLRGKPCAAVLVTSLDRLSPDPAVVERLRAAWAGSGVALVVAGAPTER